MVLKASAPPASQGNRPDWSAIEQSPGFRSLVRAKTRFIVPATIFFIVYFFTLPILVGYFPGLMERKVVGNINLAYMFGLSQFAMAWIVMALYVQRARAFDAQEHRLLEDLKQDGGVR